MSAYRRHRATDWERSAVTAHTRYCVEMRSLLALLILCAAFPGPFAQRQHKGNSLSVSSGIEWKASEYPNPEREFRRCHRPDWSLLCDPDDVLSPEQAQSIESLLAEMGNTTVCLCPVCPGPPNGGLKVAIALADRIYEEYNLPGPSSSAQKFADYLRSEWNYGVCDNTVLILVVVQKAQISISLGRTAERVTPEDFYTNLVLQQQDEFRQRQFSQALRAMLLAIKERVNTHHSRTAKTLTETPLMALPPTEDSSESGTRTALVVTGVIAVFVLTVASILTVLALMRRHYEGGEHRRAPVQSGGQGTGESDSSQPQAGGEVQYEPISIEESGVADPTDE